MKKITNICLLAGIAALSACSSTDDVAETKAVGSYFLSVSGESSEYVMQLDDLTSGSNSISENIAEMESTIQTWIFGGDPTVAVGLVYNQTEPGNGLVYGADAGGVIDYMGSFQLTGRFSTYGFYDHYAVTGAGSVTIESTGESDGILLNLIDLDNSLAITEKVISTANLTGNGEAYVSPSGILGDDSGNLLMGIVPFDADGNVISTDSCWLASFDASMNLNKIYRSGKISYASGRYRSRYYPMTRKTDEGDIYVFSGSYEGDLPCGALRISSGADDFDSDYYFNIQALTDGYHFRRVMYISDDYFLLNFYNDVEVSTQGAATRFGVVDMKNKTFSWLSDFPAYDQIDDLGEPMSYGGKMYLPVTVSGEYPAIYVIDPATATATKGVEIIGATTLNAVGRLTSN